MGMDVSGCNPKTEKGEYFRANCWSWRPIHALIAIANEDAQVIDDKTMGYMATNDGAGLKTQADCDALADAMEKVLANASRIRQNGLVVSDVGVAFKVTKEMVAAKMAVGPDRRFAGTDSGLPLDALHSPWQTSFDHIKQFIEFLRNCGGFQVY